MAHLYRHNTNGLISEFLPPKKPSNKVCIVAPGMPGYSSKQRAAEYAAKRGYWAFFLRYRGTWESAGDFLSHSPHEDVLELIDALQSGEVVEEWTGTSFHIQHPEFYVIGTSFGGSAALLSSLDERVKKVVAVCPVVDWSAKEGHTEEPVDELGDRIKRSFGDAYRFSDEDWGRLVRGELYNPVSVQDELDGSKIRILHARDDGVVPYQPVADFAAQVGCDMLSFRRGGHFGTRQLTDWKTRRYVWNFLDT